MNQEEKENTPPPPACPCGDPHAPLVVKSTGIESRMCHACFNVTIATLVDTHLEFSAFTD